MGLSGIAKGGGPPRVSPFWSDTIFMIPIEQQRKQQDF